MLSSPAVFAQVEQPRPPPPPVPSPPPPPVEPGPSRPSMESRPAAERSDGLSLLRFVQDLDAATEVDPVAESPGPQSYMNWDDEEEEAPRRAPQRVRDKFRNPFDRTEKRKAAAPAADAASQHDDSATSISGHEYSGTSKGASKGSVRNALKGIEKRRELDILKGRKFDEFMAPVAMSAQRALAPLAPLRTDTKSAQQEKSWREKLRKKASVRSLKSKGSGESVEKKEGDYLALKRSPASPSSPRSPPNLSSINGEAPPPIPPVPVQYVLEPLAANDGRMSDGGSIAPFLAYEQYAPLVKSPTIKESPATPMSSKIHRPRTIESTTTLDTAPTTPSSRDFPSGPEDPFWENAVARVRETVRREQANERREHKAVAKAEKRFIRGLSTRHEGRFKWAKLTIESLIGKYDEHGWLPKKDPKEFDDDDWKFVLEVLAHKDTRKLRDRLFQQPEWIEAERDRQSKHEQAMRTNPTPEYLAHQRAQKDRERKEYGFRKALGMLTAEELERERLESSPAVGLGILGDLGPVTPVSTRTSESSKATERSSQLLLTHQPGIRGWKTKPQDCRIPDTPNSDVSTATTIARRNVEQMTDVFNTEDFNPRLSRLGSKEVQQYINMKSSSCSEPPTPTPMRLHANEPQDSRQKEGLGVRKWSTVRPTNNPIQSLKAAEEAVGTSNLSKDIPSLRLAPLGVHPAFREPQPVAVQSTTSSRIPRLRGVRSSIPNSTHQKAPGETSPATSASISTGLQSASSKQQPPSNPRKQFATLRAATEPTAPRSLTLPPPTFDLGTSKLPVNALKAPVTRKTSVPSDTAESKSDVPVQRGLARRRGPLGSILERFERIEGNLAQFSGDKVISSNAKNDAQVDTALEADGNDKPETDAGSVTVEKFDKESRNRNPTVLRLSPQVLARLSRIPTIPDASDFSAAMSEDSGISRDATSSSLSSFTPRDRLTAKRSRIPVNAASRTSTEKHSDISTSLPVIEVDTEHPPPAMPSSLSSLASGKWEVVIPATRVPDQQETRKEAEPKTADPALGRIESAKDTTRLASVSATAEKSPRSASANNSTTPKHPSESIRASHDQNVEQHMEQHAPKSRGLLANFKRTVSENRVVAPVVAPFITTSPSERTFSRGHRRQTNSEELDASFEEVINAWQQSSPATTTQSHSSYSSFNQEMQVLRFEVGLEPIRDLVPGEAKHPNHRYSWNTKKIMCRRIHNQGVVLPSLPSPTPGQAAHMSDYPADFFVGSPYTNEPAEPQRCASCESFCCRFAELNAQSKKRTTDIVELTERRRLEAAVSTMRIRKPNGAEEWDAFLKCSQCKQNFCPDCIMLCSEELCQEPVCTDCREGTELCRIHNII